MRIETVASGKFFKSMWSQGRVLVLANNWFEWVKGPDDPKKKQPYCLRLKSKAPMFFAGLAQVHPGLEPHDEDRFVIITDASDAGMVNIHAPGTLRALPSTHFQTLAMPIPTDGQAFTRSQRPAGPALRLHCTARW